MAFLDVHAFSDALGLTITFHVLLPQQSSQQIGMTGGESRERYPVLYLLHGLSDDHTIWMRRTSIERYAAAQNLAVVMPAVGRSFYQDTASGARYWTFVSEELPAMCAQWFPISTAREDTFAAGLSMGGYGALRLGLAMPEKFAAVASLSGALDIVQRCKVAGRPGSRMSRAEMEAVFGAALQVEGTSADLWHLARNVAAHRERIPPPRLYLCCGTEDALFPDSERFCAHLNSLSLDPTWESGPGDHEWGYWDQQIQRVLAWLPLPRP